MIQMRHRVIAMALLLAGVTYLDRVALGVVAPQITNPAMNRATGPSFDFGCSLFNCKRVFISPNST